jgi:inner membrane transporter RhtA
MNLIFYLAIEYSHWTGSDTGIYRPITGLFWLKTFCRLFILAAGIVLIAPWTNNGINVLGVLFALLAGAFGLLYRPGRKGIKNKRREAVATECSLLPY